MSRSMSGISAARRRATLIIVALLVLTVLAGCGGSDKQEPTATPAPAQPTAVSTLAATPAATASPATPPRPAGGPSRPAATFASGTAQTISDGICQAQIPNSWIDNGTGRGATASAARYVLFGGSIPDDATWQQAVTLVKQYAESQPDATVDQGDDFISVTLSGDAGFEYRARFRDIYCDFSVTSAGGAVPEQERSTWSKVIASLQPVD